MVSLIEMNYQTRFCKFSIDSDSDLKSLPTRELPGKDSLMTVKSCSQGSRAYATDGKTYVLSGWDEWVLYPGSSSSVDSGTNPKKYYSCTLIGNGDGTEFTVTHNLNSANISLVITDINNNNCLIDYTIIDPQSVKLQFTEAPSATDVYNVIISIL